MADETLRDLLVHELKTLYLIESETCNALPSINKAVDAGELSNLLREQILRARHNTRALKKALRALKEAVRTGADRPVQMMMIECTAVSERLSKGNLRAASLLPILQRLAHYTSAAYISTSALAHQLGESAVHGFLQEESTFHELVGKRLTQIALQTNAEAFIDSHSELLTPTIESL